MDGPQLDAETLNEQVLGLAPLSGGTSFLPLSVPWEVNAGGVTNFCPEFKMRLLYENDTVTEDVRLGRRGEILATARDALEAALAAMPALGLCVSSGENELHREKERRVDNGCIDIDNLTDGEKAAPTLSGCPSVSRADDDDLLNPWKALFEFLRRSKASVRLFGLIVRLLAWLRIEFESRGKQEREWDGAGVGSSAQSEPRSDLDTAASFMWR